MSVPVTPLAATYRTVMNIHHFVEAIDPSQYRLFSVSDATRIERERPSYKDCFYSSPPSPILHAVDFCEPEDLRASYETQSETELDSFGDPTTFDGSCCYADEDSLSSVTIDDCSTSFESCSPPSFSEGMMTYSMSPSNLQARCATPRFSYIDREMTNSEISSPRMVYRKQVLDWHDIAKKAVTPDCSTGTNTSKEGLFKIYNARCIKPLHRLDLVNKAFDDWCDSSIGVELCIQNGSALAGRFAVAHEKSKLPSICLLLTQQDGINQLVTIATCKVPVQVTDHYKFNVYKKSRSLHVRPTDLYQPCARTSFCLKGMVAQTWQTIIKKLGVRGDCNVPQASTFHMPARRKGQVMLNLPANMCEQRLLAPTGRFYWQIALYEHNSMQRSCTWQSEPFMVLLHPTILLEPDVMKNIDLYTHVRLLSFYCQQSFASTCRSEKHVFSKSHPKTIALTRLYDLVQYLIVQFTPSDYKPVILERGEFLHFAYESSLVKPVYDQHYLDHYGLSYTSPSVNHLLSSFQSCVLLGSSVCPITDEALCYRVLSKFIPLLWYLQQPSNRLLNTLWSRGFVALSTPPLLQVLDGPSKACFSLQPVLPQPHDIAVAGPAHLSTCPSTTHMQWTDMPVLACRTVIDCFLADAGLIDLWCGDLGIVRVAEYDDDNLRNLIDNLALNDFYGSERHESRLKRTMISLL